MKEKLRCTKDYSMFELHEFNRPLHDDKRLEASMAEHGYMPSSPIQVVKNGNGKLKIVRGHHRFDIAKRLGLPIWFVEDSSNTDIFDLETGKEKWTLNDFAEARARAGDKDCEKILWYHRKFNIPLAISVSLLGGQTGSCSKKSRDVMRGKFKVASDLSHAMNVANVVSVCKENNIDFANNAAFVRALSSCLRVPEFDLKTFVHKVRLYSANLRKRSTWEEYLDEIEAFYNYGLKKGLVPIAFRAKEVLRERMLSKNN